MLVFSAHVWVSEWFLSTDAWILLFSPLKEITVGPTYVVHHILYGNKCVINFHSVHCQALLRIYTWVCLYLIYSGQWLRWCRNISATNDLSLLNIRQCWMWWVIGIWLVLYRCQLYTCNWNTLTVDDDKHLHESLLTLHKLRRQTLPSS